MWKRNFGIILGMCAAFLGSAHAETITVTMDTSALAADVADQDFGLDFYIENGFLVTSGSPGGPHTNPSNIVTITNFDYGGGFGYDPAIDPGYAAFGGASGDIRSKVTLLANRPDNELFQDFFPGSYLRFDVTFTNNVADSDLVDVFDFGLTDSNGAELPTQGGFVFPSFVEVIFDSNEPFVNTFGSDPESPTSAGQFLNIDAPTATSPNAVPEPSTVWMMLGPALFLLAFRQKIVRRKAVNVVLALLLVVFAKQELKAAPVDDKPVVTGTYHGKPIKYQIINGFAVVQGDMVIGTAQPTKIAGPRTDDTTIQTNSNTVNLSTRLWPKVSGIVTIPYLFVKGQTEFMPAITEFNKLFAGKIHWIPRTSQKDYVEINLNDQSSNACYATLGYTGGKEIVQGVATGCGLASNMHEMGHVIGLAHEQSRQDRDQYIFVNFANIAPSSQSAYAQNFSNNMDLGLYDYVSLMHYGPRGFSRNGNPETESIPVGLPFGDPPTFSAGDYDAVNRIYFTASSQTTVTSNPAGLTIIVDGGIYTAPQTFNWALNSTHTLNVPSGPQTIGGSTYIFGRWNSDLTGDLKPSRTITLTPGSGLFGSPRSVPAKTVYAVNYIHLVQFTPGVALDNSVSTPAAAGSLSSVPSPSTFAGVSGQFLVDRALVTLTAKPAAGKSFYSLSGDNTSTQIFGPSTNPVTLPADLLAGSFFADFVSTPEVRITTNVTDNNASGIQVTADGTNTKPLPAAWSPVFDANWNAKSIHSVTAASPVSPFNDAHTRYTFSGWTDGVTTPTRNIQVPASGLLTVGANYNTSYHVTANANTACAGSVSVSPLPPDGFVNRGTLVNLTATATPPFVFAGWGGTQNSSANPLKTAVTGEVVSTANFNLTTAPLTITSISPSSFAVGSPAQTITIKGTGFTPNDTTFFLTNDYLSRDVTYVNATTVTVALQASDFATAGITVTTIESYDPSCYLDVTGPSLLIHP